METAAQFQLARVELVGRANDARKDSISIWAKITKALSRLIAQPDLDYVTFQRLESKRTPQEMRRNGLY